MPFDPKETYGIEYSIHGAIHYVQDGIRYTPAGLVAPDVPFGPAEGGPDTLLSHAAIETMIALADKAPPGLLAEVGVYKGGSAWYLAQLGRELHLFDSFSGMPVRWPEDEHKIGDFADTDLNAVRELVPTAVFHVGTFPETLPPSLTGFAFVHADCDQYVSVRDCIEQLGPRMVKGGIMLFDDWNCTTGATRAVNEAFSSVEKTPQGKAFVTFR